MAIGCVVANVGCIRHIKDRLEQLEFDGQLILNLFESFQLKRVLV